MNYNEKKYFCGNCGKYGHKYALCKEPIISIGIINFKIDQQPSNKYKIYKLIKSLNDKYEKKPYTNDVIIPLNNRIICQSNDGIDESYYLKKFELFNSTIKFLMIQRKNSLGYIEFIRGRYNPNEPETIIYLFQQMVDSEIKLIEKHNIETLWSQLWSCNNEPDKEQVPGQIKHKNKIYENEFIKSKEKYELLKNGELEHDLFYYTKNIKPTYPTHEWGFPKGRRNRNETNLECAIREFNEESGYNKSDYKVLERLQALSETFIGTNGRKYKHIYYIATNIIDRELKIDENKLEQSGEIGNIGWFTFDDALHLIRPHHTQRKVMFTQLYMFILNRIIYLDIQNEKNKFCKVENKNS